MAAMPAVPVPTSILPPEPIHYFPIAGFYRARRAP